MRALPLFRTRPQVLCRGGTALPLSRDHKPSNEAEMARIHAAGGWITGQGRVNGNLNLSRSIGDQQYKVDQALPPEAQVCDGRDWRASNM